jgi:hypothetical protein
MKATAFGYGQVELRPDELPAPIAPIERNPQIVALADGRHSIVVDGQGYGVAARAELLEPARRLLGGALP